MFRKEIVSEITCWSNFKKNIIYTILIAFYQSTMHDLTGYGVAHLPNDIPVNAPLVSFLFAFLLT